MAKYILINILLPLKKLDNVNGALIVKILFYCVLCFEASLE